MEPDNFELTRLRGILYNGSELYDKAIDDMNKVIKAHPDDERAFYLRSDCYFHKGKFNLAKQDYLRALKIQFPNDVEFVEGYTEQKIAEAPINNNEELEDIKKVLGYEKKKAFYSYIPLLKF